MFRFLRPDGLLSGWRKRMLSACYQMRRIRSHLAATGPNACAFYKKNYTIWITPTDMIPAHGPLPIIDGTPKWEGEARQQQTTTSRQGRCRTPPKRRVGRGAEVLKGNRRNVRVAGRLANARQSAAILLFFACFSCFSCQLCQFLLAQLATAHRCWAQFVFMKWFIVWGRRPARLDRNQHCEVEIQHAEIHRDETSPASILQSTATSSRGTGSRSHLHLGRKRGIGWFPISWGKAGRSENLQSENSSLFIVIEVFNKSARVGAMEKRDNPVRSRIRKQEPASGTIHTGWSALRRRRMWNHCRGIFSTPPLRSLGDVVGSLPRPSLPLMAQSKETRHRLKLVWKDSVVFESRRFECLLKFIKKLSSLEKISESRANQIEVRVCHHLPKFSKKPPSLDMNAVQIRRNRQITQKEHRLVLSC